MECIYFPGMGKTGEKLIIDGDEARHMRVLNIRSGDKVMVSNGNGLCARGVAERDSKTGFSVNILEYLDNFGENEYKLGLAIGILDSRDRLEFAVEKAVELGVTHIYPLITKYVQKSRVDSRRLLSKAITALKQCRRACLPVISKPVSIDELCNESKNFANTYLMDENGSLLPENPGGEDNLVIIGPEGGFAEFEIEQLKNSGAVPINLGIRRLRAETAAIASLAFFSLV